MYSKRKQFSIIICTYNRAEILGKCLQSIAEQTIVPSFFEVIIVDNNSTDGTSKIMKPFTSKYANFRSIIEPKQGLSHARNRGCKEAKTDWVIYIDDDAIISPGYLKRVLLLINNYDFDCFGGMFYAWYLYGKPKWLPKEFGSMTFLREGIGLIDGSSGWLCGGNFAFKKEVLQTVGGFDPDFGMSGDQLGYGEDDYIQQILFDKNYKIGFDPDLVVYHAVLPHKFKLSWHLKAAFQLGRTKEQLMNNRSCIFPIFELVKSTAGLFIRRLPTGIIKLVVEKKYYWQNLLLDSFQPILFRLGSLFWNCRSSINKRRENTKVSNKVLSK